MYYNPETKEILSAEEVRLRVNASFPDGIEEVFDWHLIDEDILKPHLLDNQYAVQTGIDFYEGKWARTYAVKEKPNAAPVMTVEEELRERCRLLENAVIDLAKMVANQNG